MQQANRPSILLGMLGETNVWSSGRPTEQEDQNSVLSRSNFSRNLACLGPALLDERTIRKLSAQRYCGFCCCISRLLYSEYIMSPVGWSSKADWEGSRVTTHLPQQQQLGRGQPKRKIKETTWKRIAFGFANCTARGTAWAWPGSVHSSVIRAQPEAVCQENWETLCQESRSQCGTATACLALGLPVRQRIPCSTPTNKICLNDFVLCIQAALLPPTPQCRCTWMQHPRYHPFS